MKHSMIVGAALAILAASSGLQAQEGTWVETKFHRIHLLNGNFIDGHLVGESDRVLTMKVGTGEMQIRKDTIERNSKGILKVEYVKMRSYKEAPKIEPMRLPKRPVSPDISETSKAKDPKDPKEPPAVSAEAVTLTGSVEDQLAQVGDILRSGTPARKKGAIEALQSLGSEAASFLASRFESLEDDLLPAAAAVLMNLKEASVVATLRPMMGNSRARLREQAVTIVGALGSARDDGHTVRGALRDEDRGVRGAAIIALRRLSDVESFDAVAEFLTESDPGMRSKALATLTSFAQQGQQQKLTEAFTRVLEQTQGDLRTELLKEAAGMVSKDLAPVMVRLAGDPDAMTRSYAILALGKLNNAEYEEMLLERLSIERDYWPRIQLAGAFQTMRSRKAIDPLIEWMGDEDANIRAASVRALRGITGQNVGSDKASWEAWRAKTK